MDKGLIQMLQATIERNTVAMEAVAVAVQADADASEKMAEQVKGLKTVITATQRKIGSELGPLIDGSKKTMETLEAEVARVRATESGIGS